MRALALVFTLPLLACGSDSDTPSPDPDPDAGSSLPLSCDDPRDSNLVFSADLGPGALSLRGSHTDVAFPEIASERMRVGDCALYAHAPSFCDPECGGGGICIEGQCRKFPSGKNGAEVTLTWDGETRTAEQGDFGGSYAFDQLPRPAVGAVVRIESAGLSTVDPYFLEARIIEPLSGNFEDLVAADDTDLTITWDAGTDLNPGDEVVVHLDSDHHGTPAFIECVTAEPATSVTIDKSLINEILIIGESGIGTYIENAYMQRRNKQMLETDTDCAVLSLEVTNHIFVDSVHN